LENAYPHNTTVKLEYLSIAKRLQYWQNAILTPSSHEKQMRRRWEGREEWGREGKVKGKEVAKMGEEGKKGKEKVARGWGR